MMLATIWSPGLPMSKVQRVRPPRISHWLRWMPPASRMKGNAQVSDRQASMCTRSPSSKALVMWKAETPFGPLNQRISSTLP